MSIPYRLDYQFQVDNCYNGNIKLKKMNVQMQFEKNVVLEFIKCRDDILYFIENYVKIVSLDDGLILFKPFEFQKQIIKTYQDNRFSIVMMPRHMGKSTVTAAFLLHAAIFNKNYEIAILANKEALRT